MGLSSDIGSRAPLIYRNKGIWQVCRRVLDRGFDLLLLALVHDLHRTHPGRVRIDILTFVVNLLDLIL